MVRIVPSDQSSNDVKTSDVILVFLSICSLLWRLVKSKLGVVVSQAGELLTTFKSPLVICVGMCTRDGGKRPNLGHGASGASFCDFY